MTNNTATWPPLPYEVWRDTAATLHLWLQIVGKVALAQRPWVNHSWHVALRITARGIGTGLVPHDAGSFEIDFDFIDHSLLLHVIDGRTVSLPLRPQPRIITGGWAGVMSASPAMLLCASMVLTRTLGQGG